MVVESVSEQVGTEDSTAGKKGGRLGPERVVAAGNGGRPRAAMIEGVGGERRDTE